MAAPLRSSNAVSSARVTRTRPSKNHVQTLASVPLARPLDLEQKYAAALAGGTSSHLAPRLDGRLRVGAVQVVCSTRQHVLLHTFLAAGARMRNGRPTQTIGSVLAQSKGKKRLSTGTSLISTSVWVPTSAAPSAAGALTEQRPSILGDTQLTRSASGSTFGGAAWADDFIRETLSDDAQQHHWKCRKWGESMTVII